MTYRAEIDGLRAIAVLAVILGHAKFEFFAGGYVGVDVFFVISGFLISSIIYSEIGTGEFSILRFYERRARRIIPALVVVVVPCIAAAQFSMLPDEYENFGQSVVATVAFSNNVLLTLTSGYWEQASDFKPLLHTWSLGVEEQFYFLYPICAYLALRLKKSVFPAFLLVGTLISFSLSLYLTPLYPNSSFYLIHTRAWELLLGAVCAYYAPTHLGSNKKEVLAAGGLLAIVLAVLLYPENLPYPYFYAALPCIGAALILLYAREGTFVARLLSARPLVLTGAISYSAYLWHQPLFAFARITNPREVSATTYVALVIATLVISYGSWRFVEQPFRNRKLVGRSQIFSLSLASSVALISIDLTIHTFHGFPGRIPELGLGRVGYIAFNESAFAFERDAFSTVSAIFSAR